MEINIPSARLKPKWLSPDLLVAKIEFLRIELVRLLPRVVGSPLIVLYSSLIRRHISIVS